MRRNICQSCGQKIPLGGAFYICRTEIISGFDGFLPMEEEDQDQAIRQAIREAAWKSEQELMDEVYQEISLILCPKCRLVLRERIVSLTHAKGRRRSGKVLPFPDRLSDRE